MMFPYEDHLQHEEQTEAGSLKDILLHRETSVYDATVGFCCKTRWKDFILMVYYWEEIA